MLSYQDAKDNFALCVVVAVISVSSGVKLGIEVADRLLQPKTELRLERQVEELEARNEAMVEVIAANNVELDQSKEHIESLKRRNKDAVVELNTLNRKLEKQAALAEVHENECETAKTEVLRLSRELKKEMSSRSSPPSTEVKRLVLPTMLAPKSLLKPAPD